MDYLGEYNEVGWQNEPSRATPINAHNLGVMEDGIKRLFYYLLAGGGTGGGSAADGREVELRNNGEYIQWRYSGDEEWINLVSLSDLKGEKGDDYVLTEEDILKIAEKVKIDAPDSASDISFENEGTNLESTDVQGAIGELSGQNVDRANTLWAIMKKTAFVEVLTDAELNAFKIAWGITDSGEEPDVPDEPEVPEKTLSSITATYTGGDVPVGTAVSSLTGITVKAHYSDGSTANVTGYTLSGTIAEGTNAITVSYGGKTTTFTVTGVAESGGDEPDIPETGVSNETTWTDGVAYTYEPVIDEYVETTGVITPYNSWDRTPYLYCDGASKIRIELIKTTTRISANNHYNCFYDSDKKFISSFSTDGIDGNTIGSYKDIEIPDNAVYFICSHKGSIYSTDSYGTGPVLKIVPYE